MITYENRMRLYCWRRRNRTNTETGKAPISIRIDIDGFPRAELLTRVTATEKEWSQAAQRKIVTRGMSREEQQLLDLDNQTLAKFILTCNQGYNNQKSQGYNPSPKELLDLLRGGRSRNHEDGLLLQVCERYYQDAAAGKFGRRTGSSLRALRGRIRILTAYLTHTKRRQLRAEEVTKAWARLFDRWLDAHPYSYATRQHVFSFLGRLMLFAEAESLTTRNDFQGYEQIGTPTPPPQRHLTIEELNAFESFTCQTQPQTRAQHIFVFGCYTGLSPVDYLRFAKEPQKYLRQVPVEEGDPTKGMIDVIEIDRQKMQSKHGQANWIPLLKTEPPYHYLFTIYEQALPTYSQPRMGVLLLEIVAQLLAAGVPFHLTDLTPKDARSTCSKLLLDKHGREAAALQLNHSEAMSKRVYSTEDKRVLLRHMNILGGELSHN